MPSVVAGVKRWDGYIPPRGHEAMQRACQSGRNALAEVAESSVRLMSPFCRVERSVRAGDLSGDRVRLTERCEAVHGAGGCKSGVWPLTAEKRFLEPGTSGLSINEDGWVGAQRTNS